MSKSKDKLGVVLALLDRLEKYRLPRLLSLSELVNTGEPLSEADLKFLQLIASDAKRIEPIIDSMPQYQSLYIKLVGLYNEITVKALENEQKSG